MDPLCFAVAVHSDGPLFRHGPTAIIRVVAEVAARLGQSRHREAQAFHGRRTYEPKMAFHFGRLCVSVITYEVYVPFKATGLPWPFKPLRPLRPSF